MEQLSRTQQLDAFCLSANDATRLSIVRGDGRTAVKGECCRHCLAIIQRGGQGHEGFRLLIRFGPKHIEQAHRDQGIEVHGIAFRGIISIPAPKDPHGFGRHDGRDGEAPLERLEDLLDVPCGKQVKQTARIEENCWVRGLWDFQSLGARRGGIPSAQNTRKVQGKRPDNPFLVDDDTVRQFLDDAPRLEAIHAQEARKLPLGKRGALIGLNREVLVA